MGGQQLKKKKEKNGFTWRDHIMLSDRFPDSDAYAQLFTKNELIFLTKMTSSMNIGYARKGLDILDFFFHLQGTHKPFILTDNFLGYSATPASRSPNRSTWPSGIAFPLPETPYEIQISCEKALRPGFPRSRCKRKSDLSAPFGQRTPWDANTSTHKTARISSVRDKNQLWKREKGRGRTHPLYICI